MGNCCSDVAGGQSAVGGTNSSLAANASNEAVDAFFKSRGYNGLSSEIEVRANCLHHWICLFNAIFVFLCMCVVVWVESFDGA